MTHTQWCVCVGVGVLWVGCHIIHLAITAGRCQIAFDSRRLLQPYSLSSGGVHSREGGAHSSSFVGACGGEPHVQ